MAALSPRSVPWLAALFVVGCTPAAFLNSLDGEFLMDDYCEILDNPLMESPWPPWRVMLVGHELPSRPLPYLTFAIDHALWGKRAFGYHLTNLVIHVVAALAVFFLARTALVSKRLRDAFGRHADILAAMIASVWAVHPLHTQAVTYIYQRLESMTGMLCLVSLSAFAGAVARQWNTRWLTASVAASAAAMFSKETAVVLPLLIASYDWLLCDEPPPSGRRRRYYAALCGTWLLILVQMLVQAGRYKATGALDVSPLGYFLTQPRVILHYLRLAFWPTSLCFDLNLPILTTPAQIMPSLLYLTTLGLMVAYGFARRRAWAWPGVAFLLALAPSSSFLPLGAVAEEYRMYLALAAVAAAVVLGGHTLIRRWQPTGTVRSTALLGAAVLALTAIAILIILTQERNRVYATPGGVWLDVIEQGRGGTRTFWNLALACDTHDGVDAAIRYADDVFERNHELDVYEHLATRRLGRGDVATAARYLRHAVDTQGDAIAKGELVPVRTAAYLVTILNMQGKSAEARSLAAEHFERVQATLGADHPWTRELATIRAGGAER